MYNKETEGTYAWKVSLWSFCIPTIHWTDGMSFRYDFIICIDTLQLAIKFQTIDIGRVEKWLTVVQQPIQKRNKYNV